MKPLSAHGTISFIVTIVVQLHKDKKPFEVALFLGIALLVTQLILSAPRGTHESGVFGGPAAPPSAVAGDLVSGVRIAQASFENQPIVVHTSSEVGQAAHPEEDSVLSGMLEAENGIPGFHGASGGPITYTVKKGDVLSKIAADFGISVQTLIGANPGVRNRSLTVGQQLAILPVSGIIYHPKDGETVESIAASFNLSLAQIQAFNQGINLAQINSGTSLIIPGVKADLAASDPSDRSLPSIPGYFMQPATGFNWGKLHAHNAVDIANTCGTQIVAAAEGLIISTSLDSWNAGYGHMVEVEHPNGTKTRYAHMNAIDVSVGDYVSKGERLGTMGETGDATGCHVHFEVDGAKNPFARS